MKFTGEGFLPIVATRPESLDKFLLFEQDYKHICAEASSFARLFGRRLDLAFCSSDSINTSELFISCLIWNLNVGSIYPGAANFEFLYRILNLFSYLIVYQFPPTGHFL